MVKREFSYKEASLTFFLSFIISQFVVGVGQFLINSILSFSGFSAEKISNFTSTPLGYLLISIFQLASFVGVFIFCYKTTDLSKNFHKKTKNNWNILIFIALGIISMFSLSYFINYFTTLLNLKGQPSSTLPYEINSPLSFICSIISLAVFPAIGEELIFRATILNGLKKKNKLFALVISSVMFTIFHFNLSQLFYPFLFGLLLGLSYLITDNIYVPILMHFANNALNITLQYLLNSEIFVISISNTVLMILGIIIFIIIIAVLLYIMYKKEKAELIKNISKDCEVEASKMAKVNNDLNKDSILDSTYGNKMSTKDKIKFLWPIVIMSLIYIIFISIGA